MTRSLEVLRYPLRVSGRPCRLADVLNERVRVDVLGLMRLIHSVNPTSKDQNSAEIALRYEVKAALQSELIRRHPESLRLEWDPSSGATDLVGLRHILDKGDACHARVSTLDDAARAWVYSQGFDSHGRTSEREGTTKISFARSPLKERQRQGDVSVTSSRDAASPLPEAREPAAPGESPLDLVARAKALVEEYDYDAARACFVDAFHSSQGAPELAKDLIDFLSDVVFDAEAVLEFGAKLGTKLRSDREFANAIVLAAWNLNVPSDHFAWTLAPGPGARFGRLCLAKAQCFLGRGDLRAALDTLESIQGESDPAILEDARRLAVRIREQLAKETEEDQNAIRMALAEGNLEIASERARNVLSRWPSAPFARQALREVEERQRALQREGFRRSLEAATRAGSAEEAAAALRDWNATFPDDEELKRATASFHSERRRVERRERIRSLKYTLAREGVGATVERLSTLSDDALRDLDLPGDAVVLRWLLRWRLEPGLRTTPGTLALAVEWLLEADGLREPPTALRSVLMVVEEGRAAVEAWDAHQAHAALQRSRRACDQEVAIWKAGDAWSSPATAAAESGEVSIEMLDVESRERIRRVRTERQACAETLSLLALLTPPERIASHEEIMSHIERRHIIIARFQGLERRFHASPWWPVAEARRERIGSELADLRARALESGRFLTASCDCDTTTCGLLQTMTAAGESQHRVSPDGRSYYQVQGIGDAVFLLECDTRTNRVVRHASILGWQSPIQGDLLVGEREIVLNGVGSCMVFDRSSLEPLRLIHAKEFTSAGVAAQSVSKFPDEEVLLLEWGSDREGARGRPRGKGKAARGEQEHHTVLDLVTGARLATIRNAFYVTLQSAGARFMVHALEEGFVRHIGSDGTMAFAYRERSELPSTCVPLPRSQTHLVLTAARLEGESVFADSGDLELVFQNAKGERNEERILLSGSDPHAPRALVIDSSRNEVLFWGRFETGSRILRWRILSEERLEWIETAEAGEVELFCPQGAGEPAVLAFQLPHGMAFRRNGDADLLSPCTLQRPTLERAYGAFPVEVWKWIAIPEGLRVESSEWRQLLATRSTEALGQWAEKEIAHACELKEREAASLRCATVVSFLRERDEILAEDVASRTLAAHLDLPDLALVAAEIALGQKNLELAVQRLRMADPYASSYVRIVQVAVLLLPIHSYLNDGSISLDLPNVPHDSQFEGALANWYGLLQGARLAQEDGLAHPSRWVRLWHKVTLADAALASGDAVAAVCAVDSADVWRTAEPQSLARLTRALLERRESGDRSDWHTFLLRRATNALEASIGFHGRPHSLAHGHLPLPLRTRWKFGDLVSLAEAARAACW